MPGSFALWVSTLELAFLPAAENYFFSLYYVAVVQFVYDSLSLTWNKTVLKIQVNISEGSTLWLNPHTVYLLL